MLVQKNVGYDKQLNPKMCKDWKITKRWINFFCISVVQAWKHVLVNLRVNRFKFKGWLVEGQTAKTRQACFLKIVSVRHFAMFWTIIIKYLQTALLSLFLGSRYNFGLQNKMEIETTRLGSEMPSMENSLLSLSLMYLACYPKFTKLGFCKPPAPPPFQEFLCRKTWLFKNI